MVRVRDIITDESVLGKNAKAGTALSVVSLKDEKLMELALSQFSAVSIENELKPEVIFGLNIESLPAEQRTTAEIGGVEIEVPKVHFEYGNRILETILKHNEEKPENTIKVRGHVLVWHSQTPEWFFHEDYDPDKPYVDKSVMNLRLEWYIKTVLTYYTGENSRFRELFYGWDVVNEAVSDDRGTYRNDTENGPDVLTDARHSRKSSWWKVYNSNEYIINAFKFANRYAPKTLELYYNDYEECDPLKRQGILQLLNDVKAAEGTRLDGMGMQGHYTVGKPSIEVIEETVKAYSEAAGSVMLTEFDLKVSPEYEETEEAIKRELIIQAEYYRDILAMLIRVSKEGKANVTGITWWGVSDKYSWLRYFVDVGGAADGKTKHLPLLFDDDYQPKPAFTYLAAFLDKSAN